jgi:hypothetical protein
MRIKPGKYGVVQDGFEDGEDGKAESGKARKRKQGNADLTAENAKNAENTFTNFALSSAVGLNLRGINSYLVSESH